MARNIVYFPAEKGPFFYYRATIASRDLDWWLAKGALQDCDEAVRRGKEKASKPAKKVAKKTVGKAVKRAKPRPK